MFYGPKEEELDPSHPDKAVEGISSCRMLLLSLKRSGYLKRESKFALCPPSLCQTLKGSLSNRLLFQHKKVICDQPVPTSSMGFMGCMFASFLSSAGESYAREAQGDRYHGPKGPDLWTRRTTPLPTGKSDTELWHDLSCCDTSFFTGQDSNIAM